MPPRSIVISLFAFTRAASAAATGTLVFLGWRRHGFSTLDGLAASAPFVLAVAAGGVLNDYYDRERDAIDKPWRAIPAGIIAPSWAAGLSAALFAAAVVLALLTNYTPLQRLLLAATLAGSGFYNVVVRYAGVLKGPYVGVFSALPLAVVLESSDRGAVVLCMTTAMFVAGRELLMDVLDIRGDLATGSRTVPAYIGGTACAALAFGVQIAALTAFTTAISSQPGPSSATVQIVCWVVAAFCVFMWIAWPERRRLAIYTMWVPLLIEMALVVWTL